MPYHASLSYNTLSCSYDSAFPTLEESLAEDYTGESTVVNENGEEEILMRVVIVGAGEEEGRFVKALSEKGEGKLVGGMYLVWDPRQVGGVGKDMKGD